MGFRFRKSVRIAPGIRLNLSKGGVSTSIGRPGATVNIGKRGVRGTVGLPGSGLSYSEMIAPAPGGEGDAPADAAPAPGTAGSGRGKWLAAGAIGSLVLGWLLG